MAETILALTGAAVCLGLLVHMFLPPVWRNRVDAGARRFWTRLRTRRGGAPRPARRSDLRAANKPRIEERRGERKTEREVLQAAELEAQDVIERARRQAREGKPVARDGNVYRPDAFKPRPPHDKLH